MQQRILKIGDLERTFSVFVPRAYDARTPIPLVLVLHGGGSNADQAARMTGMNETADNAPFIAVFPEGTARRERRRLTWNAGNCCGYAYANQVDDVGFIRALIGSISAEYRVDSQRVYAVGMSNGGMLAYRLACELSDTFAAIGVVAGAFNVSPCRPTRPIALVIFHGTADEYVLYEGGVPRLYLRPRTDRSVEDTVAFWVSHNGCSPVPEVSVSGRIVRMQYSSCERGTDVVLYRINGGGHAWPGGRKAWMFADEPTSEIRATDVIWEFFARHPRS
jgi:polyhydroxybutyrate depolymerase